MIWSEETEQRALELRNAGHTYESIAKALGTTANSVKHKVRRLGQHGDDQKYCHTEEKIEQIEKWLPRLDRHGLAVLETHCGYGNLTKHYQQYGSVLAMDHGEGKVEAVKDMHMEDVDVIKVDCEDELYRLVAARCWFDVIDIDPYGFPSRLFPHAFSLINDGLMFLTFPMMGVAQINKITIRHYQAFWGIELEDKEEYVDKIIARLHDFAFMHKRSVEVLDVQRIDRVFRFALRVRKESLLKIVGLEVNR